ncbi:MAG: toxin-antitoxin system protein [Clostridia bacterium]|nr:toxin-antitoxin system protein [Clostridia bacterium]
MKPLKEKISITIDSDLLIRAKQEAEHDDRSLSQYINLILREHFRRMDSSAVKTQDPN